ncbi:MAG: DUF4142 domain-containing protein [Flavobacteriales bacterium]|nr:DUF4142 domain-containing protein [Flavobacteriales bacterium]
MLNTQSFTKHSLSALALATFFTLGAQAQDAPALTDPQIAHIAVTANQIDVNYAAIAKEKSKNKDVIHFAETMAADHNGIIKKATDLAKKLGVTPEDNATSKSLKEQEAKTSKYLRSLNGAAFDKAYIDNEVTYHKAVIGTVKNTLVPSTKNAELKALLVSVEPVLATHLEHAEMVAKEFNKGATVKPAAGMTK